MKKTMQWAGILLLAAAGATLLRAQGLAVAPAPVMVQAEGFSGGGGAPQVKDDLFAGTEKFGANASDETNVNMDGDTLGMLGSKKGGAKGDLAKKMDLVVVRTFTYDKPGMYKLEDVEAYQRKLQDGTWNCFVHVRERKSGESTDICTRKASDHESNEMVIITAEPKELTFIHLRGRMSLEDLQKWNRKGAAPEPHASPAPPATPLKPR